MLKKLSLLIVLVLLLAGTAHAQTPEPPQVQHTDPFWQVAYWNNMTLSGEPVVTASDQNLNHDWGGGSPRAGVNADRFSAAARPAPASTPTASRRGGGAT